MAKNTKPKESSKNLGGRPRIYETPEAMQSDIDKYFESCWVIDEETGDNKQVKPYTMAGLANSIGVDRKTIINYSNRDGFFHTIKNAREKVHQYVEECLFSGKNAVGPIFNLKNNFGWKDKQEFDVTDNRAIQAILDAMPQETAEQVRQAIKDKAKK